jgi:RNA polymerase sigma factor (sigma-70 family)
VGQGIVVAQCLNPAPGHLGRTLASLSVGPPTSWRRTPMSDSAIDLFVASRPQLLRYVRAHGAADDAEDLLQELWLRIAAASHPEGGVSLGYLMRAAHNLLIDRARSSRSRVVREQAYQRDGAENDGAADPRPDAERMLSGREDLQLVERALLPLGVRTNAILRRHRLDGVPQRQIAAEQAISISAVEKHLQKAYRALARIRFHPIEDDFHGAKPGANDDRT